MRVPGRGCNCGSWAETVLEPLHSAPAPQAGRGAHLAGKPRSGLWDALGREPHLLTAQVSSYCPLDLFSGEPGRMQAALGALLATPQNNLAIRVDGHLVFGGAGCFSTPPVVRVAHLLPG